MADSAVSPSVRKRKLESSSFVKTLLSSGRQAYQSLVRAVEVVPKRTRLAAGWCRFSWNSHQTAASDTRHQSSAGVVLDRRYREEGDAPENEIEPSRKRGRVVGKCTTMAGNKGPELPETMSAVAGADAGAAEATPAKPDPMLQSRAASTPLLPPPSVSNPNGPEGRQHKPPTPSSGDASNRTATRVATRASMRAAPGAAASSQLSLPLRPWSKSGVHGNPSSGTSTRGLVQVMAGSPATTGPCSSRGGNSTGITGVTLPADPSPPLLAQAEQASGRSQQEQQQEQQATQSLSPERHRSWQPFGRKLVPLRQKQQHHQEQQQQQQQKEKQQQHQEQQQQQQQQEQQQQQQEQQQQQQQQHHQEQQHQEQQQQQQDQEQQQQQQQQHLSLRSACGKGPSSASGWGRPAALLRQVHVPKPVGPLSPSSASPSSASPSGPEAISAASWKRLQTHGKCLNDEIINAFMLLLTKRSRDATSAAEVALGTLHDHHNRNHNHHQQPQLRSQSLTQSQLQSQHKRHNQDCSPLRVFAFNSHFFTQLTCSGAGAGAGSGGSGGGNGGAFAYSQVQRWTLPVRTNTPDCVVSWDLLLFPILVNQCHWCMAAVWPRRRLLQYFDSLPGDHSKTADWVMDTLQRWLETDAADKRVVLDEERRGPLSREGAGSSVVSDADAQGWRRESLELQIPKQEDTTSCGVFACAFAELLSRGVQPHEFQFSQADVPELRRGMEAQLRAGSLDRTGEEEVSLGGGGGDSSANNESTQTSAAAEAVDGDLITITTPTPTTTPTAKVQSTCSCISSVTEVAVDLTADIDDDDDLNDNADGDLAAASEIAGLIVEKVVDLTEAEEGDLHGVVDLADLEDVADLGDLVDLSDVEDLPSELDDLPEASDLPDVIGLVEELSRRR
ncbi:hypothetical protein Vafri_6996 [Volvox africanus]|uniref:Ubiquitin-like protease family profile domain-containing protein n=1 Tax=Volvox africanus TaxID=51714 RepID=A0A8J4B3K7_9CHLO|nr:hypothetical protein Vafri_6996 [Volvox africanus]